MVAGVIGSPLPSLMEAGPEGLAGWLRERGHSAFRVRQIWAWVAKGAGIESMREVPVRLRRELAGSFRSSSLVPIAESVGDGGRTTKVLYRLDGGHTVEAVTMRYPRRATLCISSQVGCPIGCPFCATGQGPFGRNLRSHEIVEQALDAESRLSAVGERLSHVVFMGMGEPLNNYRNVIDAIRRLADPGLLGLSPRRIVVSTSGLVPGIARLEDEGLPLTLAISLHAARNQLRDVLVPINRKYPLGELIPATQHYAAVTGRRVSYEWVMLAGVNDTAQDAEELAALLDPRTAHINLIPFNPVTGTPYQAPAPRDIAAFAADLRSRSLNVTIRDTRGREADAACGQLRARLQDAPTGARRDVW